MNEIKKFAEDLCHDVNSFLEMKNSPYRYQMEESVNNNCTEYCIMCREAAAVSENGWSACPVFNANKFYDEVKNDPDVRGKIVNELIKALDHSESYTSILDDFCMASWEEQKSRVIPYFVKREGNEEFLKNKVYSKFLDLAKVYRVIFSDNVCTYSFVVTKDILAGWNITKAELQKKAEENLSGMKLYSIQEMMIHTAEEAGLSDEGLKKLREDISHDTTPMWVIANDLDYASGFLSNTDVLTEVCEKLRFDDVYIIPSSIHELIVLSCDYEEGIDFIKENIFAVNRSQALQDNEVMSDSLYFYHKGDDKPSIVK